MVKNTTGGSKTKGQARKFATAPKSTSLRLSDNELELYAIVTKIMGNGMCNVLCIDNINRLCHIRGKFRGRGKKDNFVGPGSWILIGLREWELDKTHDKKLQNCDLLEVYDESDKSRLKSIVNDVNWSLFTINDTTRVGTKSEHDEFFEFSDERTEEYRELIERQLASATGTQTITIADSEEINVDDI
jgi:translation initiation factor 1A